MFYNPAKFHACNLKYTIILYIRLTNVASAEGVAAQTLIICTRMKLTIRMIANAD